MTVPIPNVAFTPLLAVIALGILVATYFVFMCKTWLDHQSDRERRNAVIDDILERLPAKRTAEGTAE